MSLIDGKLTPIKSWSMRQPAPDVTVIDLEPTDRVSFYPILLTSDDHIDHPDHCKKEFDELHRQALKIGAGILKNGDTLCAMQGRNDKRHNKSSVKPELQKNDYWNALVKYGYNRLNPYVKNLMWIGYGNHETAPIKHSEIDPLKMIVEKMNDTGGNVSLGQYRSWIVFRARRPSTGGCSYKIRAFHGAGGGGPVTKGMIAHQRLVQQTDGADLIWTGHIHEYHDSIWPVETLSPDGYNPIAKNVHAVTTPGFKNETKGGKGWLVERGSGSKPIGGAWLILRYTPQENTLKLHALYHAQP